MKQNQEKTNELDKKELKLAGVHYNEEILLRHFKVLSNYQEIEAAINNFNPVTLYLLHTDRLSFQLSLCMTWVFFKEDYHIPERLENAFIGILLTKVGKYMIENDLTN